MQTVYQALDVLVSSSAYGEAFSMVIGEAMASGVPCVATDLGDARSLIADTGRIVPVRDPEALASGVISLLQISPEDWDQLRKKSREQIEANFSLPIIAEKYAQEFKKWMRSGNTIL